MTPEQLEAKVLDAIADLDRIETAGRYPEHYAPMARAAIRVVVEAVLATLGGPTHLCSEDANEWWLGEMNDLRALLPKP